MLTACSGATAQISNASDVLFQVGDVSVTRGTEYELIKKSNGSTMAVTLIEQAIMDEEVGRGDDIKNRQKSSMKQIHPEAKNLNKV